MWPSITCVQINPQLQAIHVNNFWDEAGRRRKRRGGALLSVAADYISVATLSNLSMTLFSSSPHEILREPAMDA